MVYAGADLARVCNICFAMLFDDAALEATFSDFLKTAPSGGLHCSSSSDIAWNYVNSVSNCPTAAVSAIAFSTET